MDFKTLRNGGNEYTISTANDSARIAKQFSLEELIAGARQYEQQKKLIWEEINMRETMIKAEQKRVLELKEESAAISFGGLLTSAIGIKLRDEKSEDKSN